MEAVLCFPQTHFSRSVDTSRRIHPSNFSISHGILRWSTSSPKPIMALLKSPSFFGGTEYCTLTYPFAYRGQCVVGRNIIGRSKLRDAACFFQESQLRPRVRAIYFYTLTSIAAIFLFVIMLVVHPFVLIFDGYRRKVHHFIAKTWAVLTIKLFFPIVIEGSENLPLLDTPAVYVSNHQSFLDIYSLLTLGRTFKFISKTGVFMFPIVGWAMYMLGIIPLRRADSRSQLVFLFPSQTGILFPFLFSSFHFCGSVSDSPSNDPVIVLSSVTYFFHFVPCVIKECLRRCMFLVTNGASVFFFPEGTRSKNGQLGVFKKGAFTVAAKTRVPIVPVTVLGTGKLMPPGKEMTLNTGAVKIVIDKPMEGSDADVLCCKTWRIIANVLAGSTTTG